MQLVPLVPPGWQHALPALLLTGLLWAASPAGALQILDPSRDEHLQLADESVAAPGAFPEVDLLSLDIVEEQHDILLHWQAQAYPRRPGYDTLETTFNVQFDVDGRTHELYNRGCVGDQFHLGIFAPGWPYSLHVECLDSEVTDEGIKVHVPKAALRTAGGAAPLPGQALSGFSVLAYHDVLGIPAGSTAQAQDLLDGLNSHLELRQGSTSLGAWAITPDPSLRRSNGGETLLVHRLHVHNPTNSTHTLALQSLGLPPGWAYAGVPTVEIAPGRALIPVVFQAPFAHGHATNTTYGLLLAAGEDEEEIGLGVEYLAIPQPAGHHPVMWLHGRETQLAIGRTREAWINAREDDPRADGAAAPLGQTGSGPSGSSGQWELPLDPALLVGLDADVNSTGEAALSFQAGQADIEGHVTVMLLRCDASDPSAELYYSSHCPTGSMFPFASGEAAASIPAGARGDIAVPLRLDNLADYVPVETGDNLLLVVRMSAGPLVFDVDALRPSLETQEGSIRLPLLEFRNHGAIRAGNSLGATMQVPAVLPAGRTSEVVIHFDEPLGEPLHVALLGLQASVSRIETGTNSFILKATPVAQAGPFEGAVVLVSARGATHAVLPFFADVTPNDGSDAPGGARSPGPLGLAALAIAALVSGRRWRG